jgi:SAM-dependent methyltransferase
MSSAPVFQTARRAEVHSRDPWSPFAYVSRQLEQVTAQLIADALPGAGGRVLDYGCAASPYRQLLSATTEYVGADLPGNPSATVEVRADGTVPLDDCSFDLVLSTQVLEHVAEPQVYLSECLRLLRPTGSLVLTTHGIMYYHPDPRDYWRWTCEGLTKVLVDEDFAIAEMKGIMGLGAAALQLLQEDLIARVPARLRRPLAGATQKLIGAIDRRYTEERRLHNALVLAVRAVKPEPGDIPEAHAR